MVMFFCPTCANMLHVENTLEKETRFFCQTCPYVCKVKTTITNDVPIKKKEVEQIMGDAFAKAPVTSAKCPRDKCKGDKAYFFMLQIRSADEPMTEFYKCTECGFEWKSQ